MSVAGVEEENTTIRLITVTFSLMLSPGTAFLLTLFETGPATHCDQAEWLIKDG